LNKKKKTGKQRARGSADSSNSTDSPMDVSLLERIVRLMASNDLNTVEVRDGDKRVILKRGVSVAAPTASSGGYVTPHVAPTAHAHPPGLASGAASAGAGASATEEEAGLISIKSPMVGTFYSSPSPDAKPFVSVGSRVDEESDVCIIEAMKVFNNIKAECRGTIARILVNNGETVEFGQVLFLVKPG
jgi:acetyl-CoA carboxylase biotin carboxyl carrier protein